MYDRGQSVAKDYILAYKWLSLAVGQGHKAATKLRKRLARMMTPAQLSEAKILVGEWKRPYVAPVDRQDFEAGVEATKHRDYATALRVYLPLAEQGHAMAQNNLAVMYRDGLGIPKDYAKALKWYRLSAEQGNSLAQGGLGNMYHEGKGVPQDLTEAALWYRLSADQGNATALLLLGSMYAEGVGVPKDEKKGHDLVCRAIHNGALSKALSRMLEDQC